VQQTAPAAPALPGMPPTGGGVTIGQMPGDDAEPGAPDDGRPRSTEPDEAAVQQALEQSGLMASTPDYLQLARAAHVLELVKHLGTPARAKRSRVPKKPKEK
jgi:hypothetical protein